VGSGPLALHLQASASTVSSDLVSHERGTLARGLSGTGLTAGIGTATTLALANATTLTLGADVTHARVTADAFTARLADAGTVTPVPVTGIRGTATTLTLRADWHQPRPTGALFAGARLDLPLEGSADARVGTTPLASTRRASLGVTAGIAFDRTTLALGSTTTGSGADSVTARLSVAF